jgi:pyruvate,water dikinase
MMGYALIRAVLVELSHRWDLGRDIFFLTLDELPDFESERSPIVDRIAARRTRWQSSRRLEMGDVVDSQHLDQLGLPRMYAAADELAGTPIAAGIATGVARIVRDPAQAAGLTTDYVLVCPSTDPGWTALFVRAKGLVVEQGGVLSHGAIVARDFGIPAVVCPDATRRIPDQARVRIDGNRGRITLL